MSNWLPMYSAENCAAPATALSMVARRARSLCAASSNSSRIRGFGAASTRASIESRNSAVPVSTGINSVDRLEPSSC